MCAWIALATPIAPRKSDAKPDETEERVDVADRSGRVRASAPRPYQTQAAVRGTACACRRTSASTSKFGANLKYTRCRARLPACSKPVSPTVASGINTRGASVATAADSPGTATRPPIDREFSALPSFASIAGPEPELHEQTLLEDHRACRSRNWSRAPSGVAAYRTRHRNGKSALRARALARDASGPLPGIDQHRVKRDFTGLLTARGSRTNFSASPSSFARDVTVRSAPSKDFVCSSIAMRKIIAKRTDRDQCGATPSTIASENNNSRRRLLARVSRHAIFRMKFIRRWFRRRSPSRCANAGCAA